MDDLIADENFNFKTTKEIDITIYAKDNQNNPVKGVRINIYTGMPEELPAGDKSTGRGWLP
jgi:hypothetical protein